MGINKTSTTQADEIIHKQQLGWEWRPPNMELLAELDVNSVAATKTGGGPGGVGAGAVAVGSGGGGGGRQSASAVVTSAGASGDGDGEEEVCNCLAFLFGGCDKKSDSLTG